MHSSSSYLVSQSASASFACLGLEHDAALLLNEIHTLCGLWWRADGDTVFVIGLSSGVIENFAYVRLREVGGEGTVMGVSRFFSSITGVPMFWYSGKVPRTPKTREEE